MIKNINRFFLKYGFLRIIIITDYRENKVNENLYCLKQLRVIGGSWKTT